jgi:polygalacturonase
VTLRVGAGVTLFASRNPRDYDVTPGRCGTVDQSGRGCRALINGDHVAGAAVMGEGTIDGRGGLKLLNQDFTWWDLAEKARAGGNQNCPRLIVLSYSSDFTLYRITLKNSPNFHVYYGNGNGFTAWGVVIDTPKNARNTDGIDPSASTNAPSRIASSTRATTTSPSRRAAPPRTSRSRTTTSTPDMACRLAAKPPAAPKPSA